MGFIALILALLLEQFRPLPRDNAVHRAAAAVADWIAATTNAGQSRHGVIGWGIAVGSAVVAVVVAEVLLGMVGTDRSKLAEIAGRELPGKDITAVLDKPASADVHALRDSVLFTYSGLVLNDSDVLKGISGIVAAGENPKDPAVIAKHGIKPDLTKRGTVRSVFDGRYKFTRYFAPVQRNTPTTISELYQHNDPELFDLQNDPSEMTNLAASEGKNSDLVLAMNGKLNTVMDAEFGPDDGSEMPDFKGIAWTMGTAD